ncbi:unnamed protein product [Trichobilharzia regenti]|nr:unnamed protein product [Trichobilharzia regenti]
MDGYFMGVDFTEFVQNQLADEMNNNNNNSSSVSGQQSEQMFSVDPMIPLPQKCYNPFCGHMTAQNPAFGKHQSSGESTLYCALTKTCQGQLIHMGIPSESNYLTCPHFKSRISDVNNSSGLDQTAIFHPKTGGQFCTTIPRCSTKFMHNELSYNSLLSNNHKGINSNRRLQYGNSLILHYDHGSDIDNNNNNTVCLNELQLNSMFNESQVCCHECDTNNNSADVVPTDNKAFCYLDKNSTNINNSSNIIQILASTRVHNYSDNEG